MKMDRRVYAALAVSPAIAIACYAVYRYKSRKHFFINLNVPVNTGSLFNSKGLFLRIRNFFYRNTVQDRLWNYVEMRSEEGNPDSVLAAFDDYCYNYEWTWSIGDKKATVLAKIVKEKAPKVYLECGTFCGYSAVISALNMPEDGKILTVEANPKSAEIARKIIDRAGFGEKITVVHGYSYEVIPKLRSQYNIETLDMLFLDHFSSQYLCDLKAIEKGGYLHQGSVVFADNIQEEGVGDFSQYIRRSGNYQCHYYDTGCEYVEGIKDGMELGVYKGSDMYTGDAL